MSESKAEKEARIIREGAQADNNARRRRGSESQTQQALRRTQQNKKAYPKF